MNETSNIPDLILISLAIALSIKLYKSIDK